MSRKAYIHPAVLRAFERGEVVRNALRRPEALIDRHRAGLDPSERELLAFLRRERPRRGARRANPRPPTQNPVARLL